jgi:hypothetical protein
VHNAVQVSEPDIGSSKGSTTVRILDNYGKHINTQSDLYYGILVFKYTVWYVFVSFEGSVFTGNLTHF